MRLPCCLSNLHTHTQFCDGQNTAEEMAVAAFAKGYHTLGFSGHSPIASESWTMTDTAAYKAEIARLKAEYAGKMEILCGVEWDTTSAQTEHEGYDYAIASVHFLAGEKTGRMYAVDSVVHLMDACYAEFDQDGIAMATAYYDAVCDVLETKPDIIGHIDIICKMNGGDRFFSESDPRYLQAAYKAMDKAAQQNVLVEINTGGAYRGYRQEFYPSVPLLKRLHSGGGRVVLSSDSHDAESLGFGYAAAIQQAKAAGFDTIHYYHGAELCSCDISNA